MQVTLLNRSPKATSKRSYAPISRRQNSRHFSRISTLVRLNFFNDWVWWSSNFDFCFFRQIGHGDEWCFLQDTEFAWYSIVTERSVSHQESLSEWWINPLQAGPRRNLSRFGVDYWCRGTNVVRQQAGAPAFESLRRSRFIPTQSIKVES